MPSTNQAPTIPTPTPTPAPGRARSRQRRRALTAPVVGLGAFMLAGSALAAAGPSAFAASRAPTHGRTTCAVAGDECTSAVAYANAHDGGGARVLAVEADTEAHGGAVQHRVFDIRMATNDGVYNLHVYRNDRAPYNDGVWWQKPAENQHPSGGSGGEPGSGGGEPGGGSVTGGDAPAISAGQAAADATAFVTGQGRQVLSVKHDHLKSQGQKDYYQVKLQLGDNGRNAGTTNVWVDATSAPGTVTAASGSGLDYRDPSLVAASTAWANAVAAVGGGTVYKTNLNGGKWRWYWVFVRDGATKYKVGVDAVTGVVTQVRPN
ncbi:hypothetical protein GHK86_02495 [Acidimicrobiaceae bacterium USS-CC1]|uniref:Peptidase M4 n=1 Tax=Acidiferrimicrobium australe TaxID=2664430 RepID=A0ABW9QQH9_9ACTN|nr:hypothetical protein [Acidiferrimicrobium australe]